MGDKVLDIGEICFTNQETGEEMKLGSGTCALDVDIVAKEDCTSYRTVSCSGTIELSYVNRFKILQMIYRANRNNEHISKKYKHMKRCINRQKLHKKRR